VHVAVCSDALVAAAHDSGPWCGAGRGLLLGPERYVRSRVAKYHSRGFPTIMPVQQDWEWLGLHGDARQAGYGAGLLVSIGAPDMVSVVVA
jgi:hypothetical protein